LSANCQATAQVLSPARQKPISAAIVAGSPVILSFNSDSNPSSIIQKPHSMRAIFLLAFAVVLATALPAQPSSTFFSIFDAERGNVVAPAADGNIWLGGQKDERVLLLKLNAEGKALQKHSVGFEGVGLDVEHLTDLFEESDGTLVGCGNFESDNLGRGFVFRYDPVSRQMLWAHTVRSGSLTYLLGITRLGSGGDYVLYGNSQVLFGSDDAELLQLDRATGQIVPGKAKRIHLGSTDRFTQLVYQEGALYACGHFTDGNGGFSRIRHAVCKIDTATLEPVWSRIGPVPGNADARLEGRDVLVDGGGLISTFGGNLTDPFWPTATVFLQKNDLDGNLLWTRQYELPEWNGEVAEEIISLPDGYLLYGHDLASDTSRLFLLKTDKDGNALWARKIAYGYTDKFSDTPSRSKIVQFGDALFFTGLSQNNVGQTIEFLVKTDLNGSVNDSCEYLRPTAVVPVQMPAPTSEAVTPVVSAGAATLAAATVSVIQPDLTPSKVCGAPGSCPTLPDLQLTLDSIVCVDGDPKIFYSICNVGGQAYDGSAFFLLFPKNPLTDTTKMLTAVIHTSDNPLVPGECYHDVITSQLYSLTPFELDTFAQLFGMVGINFAVQPPIPLSGFPYAPNRPECSYLNNLDSVSVPKQLCGDCEKPITFVKKLGEPQRRELAFSMCAASDGNVYVAGKQGNNPMIAKITTTGEQIWVRNFPPVHPNEPIEWASIIEDSDDMLVLCGTEGASPSNRRAIAMRYDPATGTVLWYKRYVSNKPIGVAIVEKSIGGNFVLQTNFQTVVSGGLVARTEFFTLDRASGNTVGSSVGYQNLGDNNLVMANIVMNNGSLFAVGSWNIKAADQIQPFFAKISPSTLMPEWANLLVSDTASGAARWMTPADIAFSHDFAVIVGSGHLNPLTPTDSIFVFLEKHNADGSLLWLKRYDIAMIPEEVLTITNAYIVFGRMVGTNQLAMFKTDPNGNVLYARVLTAAPTSPVSVGFAARQNLILSLPLQILMLDHTWEPNESDLVLVRTDLNLDLDDACDLLQKVQIPVQTLAAVTEQAAFGIATNTPASAALPANADFQADSLPLRKLCPMCDSETDPDPCKPNSFLKVYGDTIKQDNIAALRVAPDGNIYVAGSKANGYAIGKMTPEGDMLWLRNFTGTIQDRVFVTEIIVDSEGMIAGCGNRRGGAGNETIVFRYNPVTNQMLWEQRLGVNNATEGGILEKNPGGNYLIYHSPSIPPLAYRNAEVLELNRTTGQILPAFAKRYAQYKQQVFAGMVQHENALYATGYTDSLLPGNFAVRRMVVTKLDAGTGNVLWTRLGLTPWSQTSYFRGFDLVVDDNSLIVLSHGIETSNTPQGTGNVIPVYLHKTTLDGEVLWAQKYLLSEVPREVIAVSDGYVILCGNNNRHLLKTDKAGKLLFAKVLNTPDYFSAAFDDWQKNQIEPVGQYLYTTDFTARSNSTGHYTTILKTDQNLDLEFDCGLEFLTVSDTAMPSPILFAATQIESAGTTTAQLVTLANTSGSIAVHQACPDCPDTTCTDKPDITFQIEAVGCDSTAFVSYTVCNVGGSAFSGPLYVGVYDSDPFAGNATLLDVLVPAIGNLPPDSCQSGVLDKVPYWGNYTGVYTLAGYEFGLNTPIDPAGFPFNGIAECDYANNLDHFLFQYPPAPTLDLGPDQAICPGDTLLLGAGLSGFVSYTWQDGSTAPVFVVAGEGLFSLSTRDGCGRTASDNIIISLKNQPKATREIVLLPGDSVVIDGQTYSASGTVISYTPSTTGGCDTLVTNKIHLDSLHCEMPASFFKTFKGVSGRVVAPAADGGYYVGGSAQGHALAKFDATGKNLWVRSFDFFGNSFIQTLIEDSEGMLVGSATSEGGSHTILVFRYDPVADQMLWFREHISSQQSIRGYELVEKNPGGDFLLVYVRRLTTTDFWTHIITFDRITGDVTKAWRYVNSIALTGIEVHQNALYAAGVLSDTSVANPFWRGGLMKIDLNTGVLLWSRLTKTPGTDLFGGGLLVDPDGSVVTTLAQVDKSVWLQKTSPNGDLIWLKKIEINDPAEDQFVPLGLVRTNDGYAVGIQTFSDSIDLHSYIVVKTDKNGDLLWAKKVPKVGGTFTISPHQLGARGNEVCFTTNLHQQVFNFTGMVLGKFDKHGNLGEPCSIVENSSVSITAQVGNLIPGFVQFSGGIGAFDPLATAPSVPGSTLQNTACSRCLPPCDSIAVQQIIEFYPGDTITLGGTDYAQSDTVTLTLTTDEGCDSVVTYILRLVVTEVDFVCPPDQTVSIPAGQSSVSVSYPQPAAATDCPDPGLVLTRLQGPASGALFPEGTTLVCYEAANQCGIRDTCCFTVTAQKTADETACDVKIPPGSCIKYELLGIRLDALGRPRYRMRLTNTCASPLRFAYFQLPNGMTAKAPLEGATYTAPGGNTYLVRNPNAAPFHSIRFKPVSGTLNNGKSDIFEYTLPKQAQPAFILVSAKLEDGSSSEAHINTFSCPVQPYVASVQEPSVQERHAGAAALVSVRPNPTSGMLFVEITGVQNQSARIQVLNAQGQLVLEGEHSPGRALQLPVGLANGLYFLLVQPADGGARVATRFVLER